MRIVFFATDDIAIPAFNVLLHSKQHDVAALVTQPDRPAGRGRKLSSPKIVEIARESGTEIIQRENLKGKQTREKVNSYGQDINIVFAYGCYIPSVIFDTPPYRTINIHPSLLPRHRGANPIRAAISCGDQDTGVSIQYVEKSMDTGDILASVQVEIGDDETYDELAGRLSRLSADLLIVTLVNLKMGLVKPVPQAECDATTCGKWEKDDTVIDWDISGPEIHNHIRAFSSTPGARTTFRGKQLQILRTSFQPSLEIIDETTPAGIIFSVTRDTINVAVPGGQLIIHQVKPEGRNAMDALSFINGFHPVIGERFG